MIIKVIESVRITALCIAFFAAYWCLNSGGQDPERVFEWLVPAILVPLAGLSGLEGLFYGEAAAREKGYEKGSNYQTQSAIALLSYAVVSVLVFALHWGKFAALTILSAGMGFFFFSAINHGIQAVVHKNYHWANLNRPFILLALLLALIKPVLRAFP